MPHNAYSPADDDLPASSSGSLASSDVNSASLPKASSPTDDAEMESCRGQNQEEVVLEAPQGDLPDSRPKGGKAPEGSKSGPGSDTAPEPSTVPESDRRRLHKKGKPTTPATSVHP